MSDRDVPAGSRTSLSQNRWSTTTLISLISTLYFLSTSVAGFWGFYFLRNEETVTTAEGNNQGIWDYPSWTLIVLSIGFLGLTAFSAYVSYLTMPPSKRQPIISTPRTPTKSLTVVWIIMMVLGFILICVTVIGAILNLGSGTKGEIEKACQSIDEECYPNYLELMKWSIGLEVVGFILLLVLLVLIGKRRTQGHSQPSKGDEESGEEDQKKLLDGGLTEKSLGRSSKGRRSKQRSYSEEKKESRRKKGKDKRIAKSLSRSKRREDRRNPRSRSRASGSRRGRSRGRSDSSSSSESSEDERRSRSRSRSRR